ncbi:hypothetical protein AVEN_185773-1 [Araneus ventricosus]|uniref:Uncharacterized protein n=1 Tax=Araneus ventricosus TaxID=182803 RepID=A0A4Y2HIH4_ARAVE|nr:hypothetical protein AVEN_185773-1 [Araneus ventricosus]
MTSHVGASRAESAQESRIDINISDNESARDSDFEDTISGDIIPVPEGKDGDSVKEKEGDGSTPTNEKETERQGKGKSRQGKGKKNKRKGKKVKAREDADPGLSAILDKATALLSEIGLDDEKCGKVVGLIFDAFGLRKSPMISKERTIHKTPSTKKAKAKKSNSSKTAVEPKNREQASKDKGASSDRQPESAPSLNFASAAKKGASKPQEPQTRIVRHTLKELLLAGQTCPKLRRVGSFLFTLRRNLG